MSNAIKASIRRGKSLCPASGRGPSLSDPPAGIAVTSPDFSRCSR